MKLSDFRLKILLEILLVLLLILVSGFVRLKGLRESGISKMLPDEARIEMGAMGIVQHKTLIFNFESPHEPPLSLYFSIPALLAFGPGIWSLKLTPALFGVAAAVAAYFFGKEFFSNRVAAISGFGVALLPFAVAYSRVLYEHSFLPFLAGCILCFFARRLNAKGPANLYAMCFLMGVGLSTKIIYIYFIAAFFISLAVSGLFRDLKLNARIAALCAGSFLLGAAPFFVFAVLSANFYSILRDSAAANDPFSIGWLLSSLEERGRQYFRLFTPAATYGLAIWTPILFLGKKVERRALFLFCLCAALIAFSVRTISGMAEYHLLVFLPAPIVLGAALIDRLAANPKLADAAAVLAVALFFVTAFKGHSLERYSVQGNCIDEMAAPFEMMEPEKTISPQKDPLFIQRFLYSVKHHAEIPIRLEGVASLQCNRFRPCGGDSLKKKTLTPDIDRYFRDRLQRSEGRKFPWDIYQHPDFFSAKRKAALEEEIENLIKVQGYKHFIIEIADHPELPIELLHEQVWKSFQSLSERGVIQYRQQKFMGGGYNVKIVSLL